MFNYVHKNSDETKILMYGHCDFTGQFDENLYTQVSCEGQHEMPEGWEPYDPPVLADRLIALLQTKSSNEQKTILNIKQQILDSVNCGLVAIAEEFIDESDLSQQTKDEIKSIL